MNLKNKKAFSLAEMMVVMLLLCIFIAASLPVLTRRTTKSTNTESIWQYVGATGPDIYFGTATGNEAAILGASEAGASVNTSRLVLNLPDTGIKKHIAFLQNDSDVGQLLVDKNKNIGLGKTLSMLSTTATNNIGIGSEALNYSTQTSSSYDVAIGTYALNKDLGNGNVSIGYKALQSKTTGASNTVIGNNSLNQISSGAENTSIGSNIGTDITTALNKTTTLGYNATAKADGATVIGYNALSNGAFSIAIGAYTAGNVTVPRIDTGGNSQAIVSRQTKVNGNGDIAIGSDAQTGIASDSTDDWHYADLSSSIAIGSGARTGTYYTMALGTQATAAKEYSVALGTQAKTDGINNLAIGYVAKTDADSGICIGGSAAYPTIYDFNNKIYIGQSTGKTYIRGQLHANGTYYTSDRRLKNVGAEFNSGLDKIRQIKTYNYTFKNDTKKTPRVGVMAQDLRKIFPQAVSKGIDGYLAIRQDDMFYAMINSIKQLYKITQELTSNIKSTAQRFERSEIKIAELLKENQIKIQKLKELKAKNLKLKQRHNAIEARLRRLENLAQK